MCVCVWVNRSSEANSVTELSGGFSKPQSVTVRNLDSFAYCYLYSLALPHFLIPAIATTQVHPTIWASPVSVPSSLTAKRGHLSTWASLVSVPSYQLPTQTSSPFRLRSYYMPIYPPPFLLLLDSCESSRVDQSCFSVASCRDHTFLLCPPPSYPVSLAHTSNKRRSSNHCPTVACRWSM